MQKPPKHTAPDRRTFLKNSLLFSGASLALFNGCASSDEAPGGTDDTVPAFAPKTLYGDGGWTYDVDNRLLDITFYEAENEAVSWAGQSYTLTVTALFPDAMYWEETVDGRRCLMQWTRLSEPEATPAAGTWVNSYGYHLTLLDDGKAQLTYLYETATGDTFCGLNRLTQQPFRQGIASGEPQSGSLILWSRFETDNADTVTWKVSKTATFSDIVQRGQLTPDAQSDYCLKVQVTGLEAGTRYYYRFETETLTDANDRPYLSLTGRAKTLPAADEAVQSLRFAVTSCSSYPHGYFNAYRQMARFDDLDYVMHLGDYIYEYAAAEYGSAEAIAQGRVYAPENNKEITTLSDYRLRHRHHKEDADLQLLHTRYTFITTWDDHETADNAYDPDGSGTGGGAVNHTDATEGAWETRKANGVRAYSEWMPIAPIADPNDPQIYRVFDFGDLAELMIMDTRIQGRHKQADVFTDAYDDASRRLVSEAQEAWLKERLSKAKNAGRTWKLIGQQVMMGKFQVPMGALAARITELDPASAQATLEELIAAGINPDTYLSLLEQLPGTGWANVFNVDQWDGYNANRQRIWDYIRDNAIDNVVVLTGDIHTSWAMELAQTPETYLLTEQMGTTEKYGVEFVTPSVTSPGLPNTEGLLEGFISTYDPHIKFTDLSNKGYMLLELTPEKSSATWYFVENILDVANEHQRIAARFSVANGSRDLVDELA
ncbi:alkaline phosphatase D family protein [Thiomicrolovo sp. ZZH C-3]